MLKIARSYEEACRTFRWRIPDRYNLAFDVCDRQTMAGADGHRTALIVEATDGTVERYTFHVLRLLSNRLANVLAAAGVGRGDRVVVSFPPSVEAAVALLAVTKMGAVAVPVPPGFGAEPMGWRLADSGARAALAGAGAAAAVLAAREQASELDLVLVPGEAPPGSDELWAALERASDSFAPVVTAAAEAALLFYPLDACFRPKGVLHGHRALPGNLPAVEFALDFFARSGDVLWTSAEWMGFEGLLWALLPAWHHGVPVVAQAAPFDPERALALMAREGVRAAFLPPSHLEALTQAASGRPHPMPRALATGPEPLPFSRHQAVERVFGVAANEIWGVAETGALAANNAQLMERRAGSPGRAVPGVTVEAVDLGHGRVLRAGDSGMLAGAPGAPGACLGLWGVGGGAAGSTALPSGWLATGRTGSRDLDGYLWPDDPVRPDGVVMVGDRRVALAEVEAVLAAHSLVTEAAVALLPSGELKAFVVPGSGTGDPGLAAELQGWVGARRARHEIPRRIEFVDALPRADDGAVNRDDLASRPLRLDAPSSDDRWTPARK
jgi:acetyl-CoA synthetase